MTSRVAAIAAAVSAAIAIGGCGSSSSSTSSTASTASTATTASVTRQDYVKAVTQRCKSYQRDRAAASKPLLSLFQRNANPSQVPAPQLKSAADKIAALNQTTITVIDDLEGLPRPAADADQLQAAFDKLDKAKAAFQQADSAAAQGDSKSFGSSMSDADAALKSIGSASKTFGFSACG